MTKQFEVYRSALYLFPGTQTVSIEHFFDIDLKYTMHQVQKINALNIGDCLELNGADLTVKRLANTSKVSASTGQGFAA